MAHDPWPLQLASSQHLLSVQRPDVQSEPALQEVPRVRSCRPTLVYIVLSLDFQFEDSVQAVVDNQHLSGLPPPASKSKPAQVGIDPHISWHLWPTPCTADYC